MSDNFKYFVWIAGLRGPEAQLWAEKDQTRDGKPVPTLTDPVKLHPKDDRRLEQLAVDYPLLSEAKP